MTVNPIYSWLDNVVIPDNPDPIDITEQMYLFWLIREDIQSRCTLQEKKGRLAFFCCYLFLHKQMSDEFSIGPSQEQIAFLLSPMENIQQETAHAITRLMYGLWRGLGLNEKYDLSTRQGRMGLWGWANYWGSISLPENIQAALWASIQEELVLSDQTSQLHLTLGMKAAWWGRPDLQQAFDIRDEKGVQQYISWILCGKGVEHPLLRLSETTISRLLEPVLSIPQMAKDAWVINKYIYNFWLGAEIKSHYDIMSVEGRKRIKGYFYCFILAGLPQALQQKMINQLNIEISWGGVKDHCAFLAELAWWGRPDLQQAFDIRDEKGMQQYFSWILCGKGVEHPLLRLSETAISRLLEPVLSIPQMAKDAWVINKYIYNFWLGAEIKSHYDIMSVEGRKRIKGYFYCFILAGLPQALQQKMINQLNIEISWGGVKDHCAFLAELAWWGRPDLQQSFDLRSESGYAQMKKWCQDYGIHELPHLLTSVSVCPSVIGAVENVVKNKDNHTIDAFGVNVIGFAKGELGIGEDVRMAAKALEKSGLPFSVYNAPLELSSRAADSDVDKYCLQYLQYKVNLICLPGFETIRLFLNNGKSFFGNHYNIGAWQWELPRWPESMHIAYNLVDELWVSSRYTADAFLSSSPVPVHIVPMTVSIGDIEAFDRSKYGIAAEDYVFLFIFDAFSGWERKNPMATIKAFRKAFPQSRTHVKLVIKTMNASMKNAAWAEVIANVQDDPRIVIINETMCRQEVMGLIKSADALVSLHRAEGFGRTLTEAMLLGKPVIATNFSGNTDFCLEKTALLVNGPTIPVGKNQYRFWEGQYWCDPDIDEAVIQMQRCVEDTDKVRQIAEAGKQFVSFKYSAEAVGNVYSKRLHDLEQMGKIAKREG